MTLKNTKINAQAHQNILSHQSDVDFSQAAPVQNTWYEMLDEVDIRLIHLTVSVADTGETLEVKITVDGNELTGSVAAGIGNVYHVLLDSETVDGLTLVENTLFTDPQELTFILEGHSVKIEVRKTTANGAGTITGVVKYAETGL